jgi:hypothetical protein
VTGLSTSLLSVDLADCEWRVIEPLLPNKSRNVPGEMTAAG